MFTIPIIIFLESFTGDKKKKKNSYFYGSIFIRKAELILWRPPQENSNVLTGEQLRTLKL